MKEPVWGAVVANPALAHVLADALAKADLLDKADVRRTLEGMKEDMAGGRMEPPALDMFNATVDNVMARYGAPAPEGPKPGRPGWFRGVCGPTPK